MFLLFFSLKNATPLLLAHNALEKPAITHYSPIIPSSSPHLSAFKVPLYHKFSAAWLLCA